MYYKRMRENTKMPVKVSGVGEVLSAMRKFEPDLAKNLNKEMRAGMTPIQKQAKAYVPDQVNGLSSWMFATKGNKITKSTSAFATVGRFPKFNASLVRRGIKISTGSSKKKSNGFVVFYRISNATRVGAIMESAGRTNPNGSPKSKSNNPNAGAHFIGSMPGHLAGSSKTRGRLLYRASDEDKGHTTALLMKALEKSITQFSQRAAARKVYVSN